MTTADFRASEKARIPAWTDRILRKGTNIRQLHYDSAPLRFSDHRPVFAIFTCMISIIDEPLREDISRQLYMRRKADMGPTGTPVDLDDSEDEDLIGYDAIEPGLPPASSDRQRWWLDNGKLAQSGVTPPKAVANGNGTASVNPNRPSNPFTPTEEPDWVAVPRSRSRLGSFSSISSSPYEHISHSMLLSSSASSTAPRKLPPPFDATSLPAKVGRISLHDDSGAAQHNGGLETPPPPPPPRRPTSNSIADSPTSAPHAQMLLQRPLQPTPPPAQRPTSAASQASTRSKAPPPVARKPAHLSTTSPTTSPPASDVREL
jgi:synaptojanin